ARLSIQETRNTTSKRSALLFQPRPAKHSSMPTATRRRLSAQTARLNSLLPGTLRCFNLRGNLGRNTLIGPRLANLDFSLLKNNHIKRISDTFNVQFRAELFNIVNHTNFTPPLDNRNVFDSKGNPIGNAGLITSTQTPSQHRSARAIEILQKAEPYDL